MVFTRYYDQPVSVPPGTLPSAPVSVTPQLETNHLERIEVDVPDGHARLTGIQFTGGGTVIVPFSPDGFIIANNHYFTIPFDDDINAGDITINAYNTDVFPHTFYVRFVLSNSAGTPADSVVSQQVPGTVPAGTDAAVAALAVTPDDLAAAQLALPPVPLLAAPGPPLVTP